ncbi:MAG: apolipoprotein N-acyltransferase [Hyphomonadaceae bacterium]
MSQKPSVGADSAARAPWGVRRLAAWAAALEGWRGHLATAGAGALATLAHAPFHLVPAFLIGIAVLVWRLDGAATRPAKRRAAFAAGWWFGAGHLVSGLYWVSSAFLVDSSTYGPLWGVPAALALGGGLALFWGGACVLAIGFWTPDWRRAATLALALALSEYLRGHLFGGLPWNLPGYIWPAGGAVSQLASVAGIYGLTALTLLLAALPATIADAGANLGRRLLPALSGALALGLVWGFGAQRLAAAPDEVGDNPIVRVADAGVSQRDKWQRRPDQEWRMLARYEAVSGAADESDAQILIWPEGAIPTVNAFLLENDEMLAALGAFLGDRALVLGFSRRAQDGAGAVHYFNSAGIIDGVSGRTRLGQIYDKNRLVPFGEFIPLWGLFSNLNIAPLQQIGAGFSPGGPPVRLIMPEGPPAVILICYEAIFPGLTPRGGDRPGWIINVTNDAWFGAGTGPWQHYNQARYRAIEEGLPLARAASGGVSAIVDAYGRRVAETGLDGGAAEAQLPPAISAPLYAQLGYLLTPLVFFGILALRLWPSRGVRVRNDDE